MWRWLFTLSYIFLPSCLLSCFICSFLFSGIGLIHSYIAMSLKNYLAFKKLKRMNPVIKLRKLARLIFVKKWKKLQNSSLPNSCFLASFLHRDLLSLWHSPFVTSIKATEWISVNDLPLLWAIKHKISPLI